MSGQADEEPGHPLVRRWVRNHAAVPFGHLAAISSHHDTSLPVFGNRVVSDGGSVGVGGVELDSCTQTWRWVTSQDTDAVMVSCSGRSRHAAS